MASKCSCVNFNADQRHSGPKSSGLPPFLSQFVRISLLLLILITIPNSIADDLLHFCEHKEIPLRRGSVLEKPLECCSYSALFRSDFTNLTVRWTVDGSSDRGELKYICFKAQETNSSSNSSSDLAGSADRTCSQILKPPSLDWSLHENQSMGLALKSKLLPSDSGVFECQTAVNSQRYVSSVTLKIREALPLTDSENLLEPAVIPPISRQNGDFQVRVCFNSAQFPVETFDPVSGFEVRVFRQADRSMVASSGRLDVSSPLLQSRDQFTTQWNSPQWPLTAPCCCWEVPGGSLKPFSSYAAQYRVFAEDKKHPRVFVSETNYSRPVSFVTPGWPASVSRAELVALDPLGSSATVVFQVKPVLGEVGAAVVHQLNITVIQPLSPSKKKLIYTDKIVVRPQTPEINKTIEDLRPFTRYLIDSYVINPAGQSEHRGFAFVTLPGPETLEPIRALRAEPRTTNSITVKFHKPELDKIHHLGTDQALSFQYSIAYEILLPDLSTSVCPNLDELCDQSAPLQYGFTSQDCQCVVIDASSSQRFIEEQQVVEGLRENRPYRVSVRYQFNTNQLAGSALLWPVVVHSAWANVQQLGGAFVFTESVPLKNSPHIRNISLSLIHENSTSLIVGFDFEIDLLLDLNKFEAAWALDIRSTCANFSKIVPLNHQDTTFYQLYKSTSSSSIMPISISEQIFLQVDLMKEKMLLDQLLNGPKAGCSLIACPLTRSRVNSTHRGSVGPCSREKVQLRLPLDLSRRITNGDSEYDIDSEGNPSSFSKTAAMKASIAAVVVTIFVVLIIVAIIVVLYLRRNKQSLLCCCFEKRSGKSSASGDLPVGGVRRQSAVDLMVQPNACYNSQQLQLLPTRDSKTSSGSGKQKRPLSCLSSNDGPLAGSMFCFKVASAGPGDYAQEFTAVCSISAIEARKGHFSCSEAEKQHNLSKNRYSNVLPYDHSRVTLLQPSNPDLPGADYVNANFVQDSSDPSNKLVFIACQGPLQWTTADFWQVIYERKCSKVVMLTDLVETASTESARKCAPYWPRHVGSACQYKSFRLMLMRERRRPFWIERLFELSKIQQQNGEIDSSPRLVLHFQYVDWPDHGVPSHALPLLRFTQRVISAGISDHNSPAADNANPIVVHCSAGIGRSGVFMVLANELERLQSRSQLDPSACLIAMRRCRANLVQTPEQFRFIYLALYEAVRALEVGDHSGVGVPTESGRLQAWLRNCADSILDWATSRVPNHSNALDSEIDSMQQCFFLPGPLHSRQIAIVSNRDQAFLSQRLRMWSLPSSAATSPIESSLSLNAVSSSAAPSAPLHVVFFSSGEDGDLLEYFRHSFPRIGGFSSISTWPPSHPARIFSTLLPYLLSAQDSSSGNIQSTQKLSSNSLTDHQNQVCEPSKTPNVVIVAPDDSLRGLSLAAELALAVECLSEARLSFAVDADPEPDQRVDLLLIGRIATLTLPPGVVTRASLQRALSLVAQANSSSVMQAAAASSSPSSSISSSLSSSTRRIQ